MLPRDIMHRSMTLILAYLNNRLQLDFHHKQVVNKGAHVIVVKPIVIQI